MTGGNKPGARVRLRPWQRADDADSLAWPPHADPLSGVWNLQRPPGVADVVWTSFGDPSIRRTWAIERINDERLIGRISLRDIDVRRGVARLGITLGQPFVSRGLGTEALECFLRIFFEELGGTGFQAMVLDVAAVNLRAVRCYDHLGFRYIASDWRDAGGAFDPVVLDSPAYADRAQFFRRSGQRIQAEFYEMRLERHEWRARVAQQRV
jgi:RimJ/RimL family protein N-acetyltransferase